jgi:hypothetical protein
LKRFFFILLVAAVASAPTLSGYAQKSAAKIAALKKSPAYNRTQKQNFPAFTYQSPDDPNLLALRKQYNLDSIAGQGSDINRAIRLLEWFHNTVPHEDVRNLPVLTAQNIIDTYRKEKIAQGCYPLAIAMNEIFLSMGFKSRVVICYSNRYPEPEGGHVINAVFISSLDKWVYMDPQDNAYVKDEKGNFLSVAEVRERLIDGRPLVLNATANYHGTPSKKENYLYEFMGEHMYRMICPVNSAYNSETRSAGKTLQYTQLLPYGSLEPIDCGQETKQNKDHLVIGFHTTNDELFWQKP